MASEHAIGRRSQEDARGSVVRRIVITGAQGFLGRYLVADALESDIDVQILGLGRSPRSDDHFTFDLAWRGGREPRHFLDLCSTPL